MWKKEEIDKIRQEKEAWEQGPLKKILERFPERQDSFKTHSKIPVDRVYTPIDLMELNYSQDLSFPGQFPYTRGVQSTMFRGRLWTMRQYAGFGDAEETNSRYKYLLEQGQTGLSVAFDLPTQIGLDSDHSLATGEVGRTGVAISSLKDMEVLFEGIPLDKVSTSMTINAPAMILLAMYIAVAEQQGVPPEKLTGTIQNDILKEYTSRSTFIYPPRPSMRLITDTFEYLAKNLPRWNSISISGYHMREAGATAVQELAFTFANAIAYVEAALSTELNVDDFAPRLSFFFGAHNNFLEEIAKFRAARRIWARIMKNRFGAKNSRSMQLRFHTQTCGCTLTAQQPDNNIVRVAYQALAGILGGTNSLHTNSRDEALALPTEEAVTLALRTQQIIAYETEVGSTIDPLAGSYYIEFLTNQIEVEVMEYLDKIDEMGGALVATEQGYIQREIHDSAYEYQMNVETGEQIVVGVNKFFTTEKPRWEILKVDPKVETKQKERLNQLKRERDNDRVLQIIVNVKEAAQTNINLMPVVLEAVKAYATLGEICDALREVWGEYKPVSFL